MGAARIAFVFVLAGLGISSVVSGSPHEISPLPAPTTPLAAQSRTAMKHRAPPVLYSATRTGVANMIALSSQLPATLKNPQTRRSGSPISPIEKKVYAVEGDLWRVKMEGNDDDYHLELAARRGSRTADRIIVEIPAGAGYVTARKQLLSLLPGNYVFHQDTTKDLTRAIPIRVTGYGFCDTTHWTAKSVRGNKHGTNYTATLWELHPAWKVEALKLSKQTAIPSLPGI